MDSWCWASMVFLVTDKEDVECAMLHKHLGLRWQVRQLQALGFGLPRELLAEVRTADKSYRWDSH
jgi:hypothetical protein